MKQSDLINEIHDEVGLPKTDIKAVLDGLAIVATRAFNTGDEVPIVGLGKLKPKTRAARTGRNPRTREPMAIPASRTVTFTPASSLKEALN